MTSVAGAMAGVLGARGTTKLINYTNPEVNLVQDIKLLLAWVVFFAFVTPLIQRLVLWPIARKLIEEPRALKKQREIELEEKTPVRRRFSRHSEGLESFRDSDSSHRLTQALGKYDRIESKRWKFVVAGSKLFSYIFFFAFSVWALQDQWHWFWDATQQHIAFESIPWRLRALYFMETAHYTYTLVAMFWEPKMKDRAQMVFHHLFTITLLTTSYHWGTMKYGTSIMVLHDFSDPWMEAAKLFNYVGATWGANICFVIFALSFVFLRVYVFPRHIIAATYNYARPTGYPHYWITFASLTGLWVLHCIWTYMIWRVFHTNVILGKQQGDVREEEDD